MRTPAGVVAAPQREVHCHVQGLGMAPFPPRFPHKQLKGSQDDGFLDEPFACVRRP